jgi:hypothetical protein
VEPGTADDYFATEVVRLFGLQPPDFLMPSGPGTSYYRFGLDYELDRTGRISGPHKALVAAVLMPLQDLSQLDRGRIEFWKRQSSLGASLTALAVSVVDDQEPADQPPDNSYKYKEQFLFTSCLLDGHHRVQAAAELGAPARILSLVASEFSLVKSAADLAAAVLRFSND